jgi:hypothetical protein
MDIYPHLPSATRRRNRWQFSTRMLFLVTAVVALGTSLFKAGGLFIISGILGQLLVLVGVAVAVSHLRAVFAGVVCVLTLALGLLVAFGISERWYAFRSGISRLLAASPSGDVDADLVLLWMCFVAGSMVLGTLVGWGMAVAQEGDRRRF